MKVSYLRMGDRRKNYGRPEGNWGCILVFLFIILVWAFVTYALVHYL